jgi:hypothetical protein
MRYRLGVGEMRPGTATCRMWRLKEMNIGEEQETIYVEPLDLPMAEPVEEPPVEAPVQEPVPS